MNKRILSIVIVGLITIVHVYGQVTRAEIVATGLTCSMCSNAINKQLKSLAGVDSVTVDLNTNTFVAYVIKDATISPRIFKERVEKAGFFVGSMLVSMQFDNTVIPENKKIEKDGMILVILESKSQVLNGEVQIKVMDKGYVTQKEYKKLSKSFSKIPTYQSGNEDDYHIKIQQP
jgi:copper chaperone CopZ